MNCEYPLNPYSVAGVQTRWGQVVAIKQRKQKEAKLTESEVLVEKENARRAARSPLKKL